MVQAAAVRQSVLAPIGEFWQIGRPRPQTGLQSPAGQIIYNSPLPGRIAAVQQMITRVELTNFMSHKHTVIEPAAGLTVLVGPNNVGKSAVVAALQILCHNDNSTYVQRHGERECSVKVHTDDGHVIEWRRKKNAPSYIINGTVFDRLRNSGLPDELAPALRLRKVDADGDSDFDVHFGTQKAPVFLLGSSAANAARFFASSSDAIRLVAIQKRHKEKLSEAQREKNRLEVQSRRVNAELGVLEPVVEVEHRLAEAERTYEELAKFRAWIDEAARHEAELRRQEVECAEHIERARAFSTLAQPPNFAPSEPLERLVAALKDRERERAQTESHGEILASLAAPPPMHDAALLDRLIQTITEHAKYVQQGDQECRSLSRLMSPPELADLDTLRTLIERLTASAREAVVADGRNTLLSAVMPPPVAAPTEELEVFIAGLKRAAAEALSREADLEAARKEFETADEELRLQAAGSLCPICGGTLDPDRIVARAASGGRHDHD